MKRFAFLVALTALAACSDVMAPHRAQLRAPAHALAEVPGWTTGPCWLSLDHVLPLHDNDGNPTGESITLVETDYYANCPTQDTVSAGWYRTAEPK